MLLWRAAGGAQPTAVTQSSGSSRSRASVRVDARGGAPPAGPLGAWVWVVSATRSTSRAGPCTTAATGGSKPCESEQAKSGGSRESNRSSLSAIEADERERRGAMPWLWAQRMVMSTIQGGVSTIIITSGNPNSVT